MKVAFAIDVYRVEKNDSVNTSESGSRYNDWSRFVGERQSVSLQTQALSSVLIGCI